MSVKIKVSYESQKELLEVIKRLRPMVQSYKVSKSQQGQYKKAYIILKNTDTGND